MHWYQPGSTNTTTIGGNNGEAGKWICANSSCDRPSTSGLCSNNMKLLTLANCDILYNEENESKQDYVKIYPNPIKDEFNIMFENKYYSTISRIIISNSIGEEVFNLNAIANTDNIALNINHLASGIYFVTLFSENNTTTLKCIKQ